MRSEPEIKKRLSDETSRLNKLKQESEEHTRMHDSPSGSDQNPYLKEIAITESVIQALKWVLEKRY